MGIAVQYRNLAVRHKLRLIIMVTVGVALVLACAAVVAYDQLAARKAHAKRSSRSGRDRRIEQHRRGDVPGPAGGRGTAIGAEGEAAHHRSGHLFRHGKAIRDLPAGLGSGRTLPALRSDGSWFEGDRLSFTAAFF